MGLAAALGHEAAEVGEDADADVVAAAAGAAAVRAAVRAAGAGIKRATGPGRTKTRQGKETMTEREGATRRWRALADRVDDSCRF